MEFEFLEPSRRLRVGNPLLSEFARSMTGRFHHSIVSPSSPSMITLIGPQTALYLFRLLYYTGTVFFLSMFLVFVYIFLVLG